MLRRLFLPVALTLALSAACNRDSNPPPQFAEAMETPGGKKLAPMKLPDRKDEGLIAPIAAAEQPAESKEKEKGEKAAEIKVDDSSPAAVARMLVEMSTAMDWTKLPDVLVTEQSEGMKSMIDSIAPFLAATGGFHKAVADKLAGAAVAIELKDPWLQQLADMTGGLKVPEEPAAEGEEVKVTFAVGAADAADAKKIEWTAKKVENAWKFTIPDFQAPSDAAAVAKELESKTAGFRDLAKRIESEDLKDADAVKTEIEKVMSGKYEAAGGEKKAEDAKEEPKQDQTENTAPNSNDTPKTERPKSELERDVDGAGQRRIGL